MVKKGVIKGNGKKLNPHGKITKAEVIVILKHLTEAFRFETISFEDGVPSTVSFGNSEGVIVSEGATDGSKALRVNYDIADFPTVRFTPDRVWNFGRDVALSLDVTNPTDTPVALRIRVDDSTSADGSNHSTVSTITILPHDTQSMYLSYSQGSIDLGMRGLPPSGYGTNVGRSYGETVLDTTNITQFQFWLLYNLEEASLIFDNIKVIPDPNVDISYTDDTVDQYGQYTGLDWEGKVKNDQDLLDDKAQEAIELENGSSLQNTNEYGGWLDGPNLGGTGFFRAEKYNGVWSLVDPEGYLFFATGVDILRLGDSSTWIDGRDNMFAELPDPNGPLGDHYTTVGGVARPPLGLAQGTAFNHYSANLERKYGENYLEEWKDVSIKRFKNWGFSTIGNWADPNLFFGKGEEFKLPYAATGLTSTFGNHARITSRNGNLVADPFDPEYKVTVKTMVEQQLLQFGVQNDPWCMGVYVDNEIEWGGENNNPYIIVQNAFMLDASAENSYAKRAFIEKLKDTYTDIQALNTAWGTDIASWKALEAPYTFPEQRSAGVLADLSMMIKMYARQYFSTIDEELTVSMPNILYLGCRFADWGASAEVQEVCAEFVDVVSFNVYYNDINQAWIHAEQLDKPCIWINHV